MRILITVDRVLEIVGSIHGVDLRVKPRRDRRAERARGIAMYIARHTTRDTYLEIAKAFRTSCGTVINKVQAVSEELRDDVPLRAHIRAIESVLNGCGVC